MRAAFRRVLFSKKFWKSARNFSENVIHSKGRHLQIPTNVTLHEYVWRNYDRWSDRTAVICYETGRKYTYEELHKNCLTLAGFLRNSLRLNKNDTAAIVLPNVLEYPVAFMGSINAGLKVTTCNPNYTPDEIKRQLVDAEAKLIFTSSSLADQVRRVASEIRPGIPVIVIKDGKVTSNLSGDVTNPLIDFNETITGELHTPVPVSDDDVIVLPYSSGTTGIPKGVQLTLSNIISNLEQTGSEEFTTIKECENDFQDVIPAQLPFFHIYGMVMIMLHGLAKGCKLIIMPKFGANSFVDTLRRYRPTVLFGVPTMVNVMTNHSDIKPEDLLSLRTIISGAAPLGAADLERFQEKTKGRSNVFQAYGMTELSPLTIIQTTFFENGFKIGGSGLVVSNTSVKVVSDDGSSLVGLGPGQSGELMVKGPQVMKGYFNNPQATKEVLSEDGWLRTGDVAHYDEHEHFFITDRIKELIKVKGLQVAPAELESILRGHPGIDDAAVIGVPHPHAGEVPRAFIVRKKEASSLTASNVAEYVASNTAPHKHLVGGVIFVDSIPKNPSGKILRRHLKNYA